LDHQKPAQSNLYVSSFLPSPTTTDMPFGAPGRPYGQPPGVWISVLSVVATGTSAKPAAKSIAALLLLSFLAIHEALLETPSPTHSHRTHPIEEDITLIPKNKWD
jgi:hypothetical protein